MDAVGWNNAALNREDEVLAAQSADSSKNPAVDRLFETIDAGRLEKAVTLFKRTILTLPVSAPVQAVYNHLLCNLVHKGMWEPAIEVYGLGKDTELKLKDKTYLMLVHVCSERQDRGLYADLFREFELRNVGITEQTYLGAFHLANKRNESARVYDLYQAMIGDGIVPHTDTVKACWIAASKVLKEPVEKETYAKCRSVFASRVPVNYGSASPLDGRRIKQIQASRMAGSSTLARDPEAVKRWHSADTMVRNNARDPSHTLDLNWIYGINKRLGAAGGGVLRTKAVGAGGQWELQYAPAERVQKEMECYVNWLQSRIQECDAGRANPIETAARAYQRLVSIHPFMDQNGRTSRLVMDYVLMRYELPPAAIGEDIAVARFALKDNGQTPTEAAKVVLEGIERSYQILLRA